jgi:hypothetical protein
MSDQDPRPQPEPPGLDLEAWHRDAPFPPTWQERDKLRRRPQPRLDTLFLFGPDPIPRRRTPQ